MYHSQPRTVLGTRPHPGERGEQSGSVLGSPEGQSEVPGLSGPGVNGRVFRAQTLAKPGCVRASGQDAAHTALQFLDPSGHLLFFLSSLNTLYLGKKKSSHRC